MNPLTAPGNETDGAFEELLLKKNGDPKTVQDLFECFVALNHDQKTNWRAMIAEIRAVAACVDAHRTQDVNMTKEEFAEFMAGRDQILHDMEERIKAEIDMKVEERNKALAHIDKEIQAIWADIHRDPRRAGDPKTEDWGKSVFGGNEAENWWQVITAWKTLKWLLAVVVVLLLDVVSHYLLGGT